MKEQEQNHRMLSPPAFHECGEERTVMVTEHMVSVPLYHNIPRSPRIDICFSIVERATATDRDWFQHQLTSSMSPKERAKQYLQRTGLRNADDMMIYLQGGPGFESPTPVVSLGFSEGSSWAAAALDKFSRIVFMDQRGTGRYVDENTP
jgi:hypothetical protein